MPTITQLVKYLNKNKYISKACTITAKDLALHFGISDGGTEVGMRNIIRNAIAENQLIGSTVNGFYMIGNPEELKSYLKSLESRADKTLIRRNNLIANWNAQNPKNKLKVATLFAKP